MIGPLPVVLDVQAAQSVAHGSRGIARYAIAHAIAIEDAAPGLVDAYLLNPRFTVPSAAERLLDTGRVRWMRRGDALLERGPLLFHVMSPFEEELPVWEVWPAGARRPEVALAVTLYDLIPMVFEDVYLRDPMRRARYRLRTELVRSADLVLAISESTRRDGLERLGLDPPLTRVIGAGVAEYFGPRTGSLGDTLSFLSESLPGLRPGYFLYTGGVDFRKNMDGLIRAYADLPAALRARHQMVVTCRLGEADERHLRYLAAEGGAATDVLLTNWVPDGVLRALYQAAHVFVFPSRYEGFGLPAVEAMRCGAPVIAAGVSSLPEIVRNPEALFDPDDLPALTALLARCATDRPYLERLRRNSAGAADRFTWRAVAEATIAGYEDVARRAGARRRPDRPRRRRVAMFSPYPPQLSGVALYSANLIAQLGEWCDVDCFVDGAPSEFAPPSHPACRLLPAVSFRRMHELVTYDRVIYCMGNSHFHDYVLRTLRQVPGDVIAHDVRLSGLYGWRSVYGHQPFVDAVRELYGPRVRIADGTLRISSDEARRLGVWMTGEVLRLADRVFVHSAHAREVARLEAEACGAPTPVECLPFGFPFLAEGPPPRLASPAFAPLVTSFGLVDRVKGVDAMVRGLPAILARHPRARLALVGPIDEDERRRVEAIVREAGMWDRVEITGAVDDADYQRWLRRTDVALQLRELSQGEASATVSETLARGVPTIVSRIGWMADLPDDAVVKLGPLAEPREIADAVCELLETPDRWRALGERGARHASENDFRAAAAAVFHQIVVAEPVPVERASTRAAA